MENKSSDKKFEPEWTDLSTQEQDDFWKYHCIEYNGEAIKPDDCEEAYNMHKKDAKEEREKVLERQKMFLEKKNRIIQQLKGMEITDSNSLLTAMNRQDKKSMLTPSQKELDARNNTKKVNKLMEEYKDAVKKLVDAYTDDDNNETERNDYINEKAGTGGKFTPAWYYGSLNEVNKIEKGLEYIYNSRLNMGPDEIIGTLYSSKTGGRKRRKTRRKTRCGGRRRLYRVKAVKAWLKRTKRRRKKRKSKKKKKKTRRRRTRR